MNNYYQSYNLHKQLSILSPNPTHLTRLKYFIIFIHPCNRFSVRLFSAKYAISIHHSLDPLL